jgi:hypothetical protein
MRKTAAAALALPIDGLGRAATWLRRSARIQGLMVSVAITLVVGVLLVGLPATPVAGQPMPTFAPLAPQADAHSPESGLALDVPFQIQFTKPMNEGSVEAALRIDPKIDVEFRWDATGQMLSLVPNPHWEPTTNYQISVSNAASDQEGLGLSTPVQTSFQSGSLTAGTISANRMVGDLSSPTTAFQLTFTQPVKLGTVLTGLGINPALDVGIVGDDPTDVASQVFTMTPKKALNTDTTYLVIMAAGGVDASGSALQSVAPLQIHTLATPTVQAFRPASGTKTYDTNQPISLRFTVAMDEKSTESALTVLANGRAVAGSTSWSEEDTVVAFAPRRSFAIGTSVTVKLSVIARSTGGLHVAAATSATFLVSTPRSRAIAITKSKIPVTGGQITKSKIPVTGGQGTSSAPYKDMERYYLSLMNCTRTGSWVTSSGDCSTQTRHTLPAQGALALDDGISNKVSRPYAAQLATSGLLTHNFNGTTADGRLAAAGYGSGSWGENIASPGNASAGGMIAIETFYQSESGYRGLHYKNIMNRNFHRAGIGIWVSNSVRVVIDFYG